MHMIGLEKTEKFLKRKIYCSGATARRLIISKYLNIPKD